MTHEERNEQSSFLFRSVAGTDTSDADLAGNRQQRRHRIEPARHRDASARHSQHGGKVRLPTSAAFLGQ